MSRHSWLLPLLLAFHVISSTSAFAPTSTSAANLRSCCSLRDVKKKKADIRTNPPALGPLCAASNLEAMTLSRPHERILFSFYAGTGAVIMALCKKQILQIPLLTSGICLMWASFVLAISFMEAWVKFKAPFLRKDIAVDVGRHVFSALHAVELALAANFWMAHTWLNKKGAAVLPGVATGALVLMAFGIAPLLYTRAKIRLVAGLSEPNQLQEEEKKALKLISKDVANVKNPPAYWHVVYILLEMLKLTCLLTYAIGGSA